MHPGDGDNIDVFDNKQIFYSVLFIQQSIWLTVAIFDSENPFLFYDVIDISCNKFSLEV